MNAKFCAVLFLSSMTFFGQERTAHATDYAPPADIIYPVAPTAEGATTFIPDVPALSRPTFYPTVPEVAPVLVYPPPSYAPDATRFEPQTDPLPLAQQPPEPQMALPAQTFIPHPEPALPADVFYP